MMQKHHIYSGCKGKTIVIRYGNEQLGQVIKAGQPSLTIAVQCNTVDIYMKQPTMAA